MRNPILNLLRIACLALLITALARPQTANSFAETQGFGRDIFLVLDISASMSAVDFFLEGRRVDRLTALKEEVKKFIDKRRGDRMSIITFADTAYTLCPLTQDTHSLKTYVDSLDVGMAGQGTAIGDALGIATKRARAIESDSKVIILVTDGKSNAGTLSPQDAAAIAGEENIKIHVIGIGGEGYAPMPVKTVYGGIEYVKRKMDYDEPTLKEIAASSGGQYFKATGSKELASIYSEVDRLEEREDDVQQFVTYDEHFYFFLMWAVALFLIHEFFAATLFLVIP